MDRGLSTYVNHELYVSVSVLPLSTSSSRDSLSLAGRLPIPSSPNPAPTLVSTLTSR